MWQQQGEHTYTKHDVESGAHSQELYSVMSENTEFQSSFMKKVYSIIAIQLIAIIIIAAIVAKLWTFTNGASACYIILVISPLIVLCPLYYYHHRHPLNYVLLGIFSISLAFSVGLICAFTSWKIILASVILTAAVVLCVTLYTFWAAKRGRELNFLGAFLFGSLFVLIIISIIQIFFPLGKIGVMIYVCVASIIICGYEPHQEIHL